MEKELNKEKILSALKELDNITTKKFDLIMGGGSAIICSYGFPLGTTDVDVIIKKAELSEVDKYIKKTARKLSLPLDWMNTWFSSFTHYLPLDYEKRLVLLFKGEKIVVKTFGKEDLLILKCFSHRAKDVSHAKILIRKKADIPFVEKHIQRMIGKKLPKAEKALNFLYDLLDEME